LVLFTCNFVLETSPSRAWSLSKHVLSNHSRRPNLFRQPLIILNNIYCPGPGGDCWPSWPSGADLLSAVNGEGSNELTPCQWREGLRAHHLLPLPISAQPAGPVLGPLPLPRRAVRGYGLKATHWSFQPLESGFERTPYGVIPPNGEGHG